MCDTFFGPAKRPEMLEIRKLNDNFTEEISAYKLLGSIHTYYIFAIKKIIKENFFKNSQILLCILYKDIYITHLYQLSSLFYVLGNSNLFFLI